MLNINNLTVSIQDKTVIQDFSFDFKIGKNYCILGSNGSGKSSLAMSIMGHPDYKILSGEISIIQDDKTTILNQLGPDIRSQMGIFLAFQHIPEIKGIKLFEFFKSIYDNKIGTTTSFLQFKKIIEPLLLELKIDKEFLRRDLNVGFSGGERRKTELLQIKLLQPQYIFLDEVDSGLDVDAFNDIAQYISQVNNGQNSFIIITHIFKILDHLPIDDVIVLKNGQIQQSGDHKLIKKISELGFNK